MIEGGFWENYEPSQVKRFQKLYESSKAQSVCGWLTNETS